MGIKINFSGTTQDFKAESNVQMYIQKLELLPPTLYLVQIKLRLQSAGTICQHYIRTTPNATWEVFFFTIPESWRGKTLQIMAGRIQ